MNTCSSCKFWHASEAYPAFRSCASPHISTGANQAGLPPNGVPHNGIHIENSIGWGIIVSKDFGCIHHEAVLPYVTIERLPGEEAVLTLHQPFDGVGTITATFGSGQRDWDALRSEASALLHKMGWTRKAWVTEDDGSLTATVERLVGGAT